MTQDKVTVWHVTPESNIESVQENGLQTRPCGATWLGDKRNPERVMEGVYVCRRRRTMETYAATCLNDVRREIDGGEQFALFKAKVSKDRLTTDPESDVAPETPDAWIHADPIDDPELVTVGVLDEPAGNYNGEQIKA